MGHCSERLWNGSAHRLATLYLGHPRSAPSSENSAVVKSLQRQLREQDQRLEKLQSRLEALKLIEEDRHKRTSLRLRQARVISPE